jgi:predicted nucleic acid-binding protein
MGLSDLVGAGPVGIDTAVFIYFLEEHPAFLSVIQPLFAAAARGEVALVTSAVTLLEVLVVPYRAGNATLARRYETLLTESRELRLVDVDRAQSRAAARLRALYRLRTPDALQIAAALTFRCTAFVTNDRDFPDVTGLAIVRLSQLI